MSNGLRSGVIPLMMASGLLSGCAVTAPPGKSIGPDRRADAAGICQAILGLDPANAPHGDCVRSLLQNETALTFPRDETAEFKEEPAGQSLSDFRRSCAQFGGVPGTNGLDSCAANLRASLFEAYNAAMQ